MTNKKDDVFEAVQGPAPKACSTSCASPGVLICSLYEPPESKPEFIPKFVSDTPKDCADYYEPQWSDPGNTQLFACLDVCTWSRECSMSDDKPDHAVEKAENAEEIYKCRDYGDGGFLLRPDMPIPGIQMDPDTGRESHEEDDPPYMNLEVEVCDSAEDVGDPEIDEDCVRERPRYQSAFAIAGMKNFGHRAEVPKRKQRAAKQDRLTTDQLTELLAIDKRVGLRSQLQRMLHALNSGGQTLGAPAEDIAIDYHGKWWEVERQRQALVLWQKGIGRALGFASFRKYLASIPEVPPSLRRSNGKFNRMVLVEGRLGLKKLCQLAGVLYHCSDYQDPEATVRWMRCQDGRRYRNESAVAAQSHFAENEMGLNLFEGVCLYMQFPRVLCEEFNMICTKGPQIGSDASDASKLFISELGPEVSWAFFDARTPTMGAASKLVL